MTIRSLARTFLQIHQGRNVLWNRCVTDQFSLNRRINKSSWTKQNSSKNDNDDNEDWDKPIKYSETEAAKWKAHHTGQTMIDAPSYHNFIVIVSLGSFMIYFFILREENDIDELFDRSLYEHFPQKPESVTKT